MSKPIDLVRQVEQFDDEDWYTFLEALDEASRRRRRRPPPPMPAPDSRDEVAVWVARGHLFVATYVREIHYLPAGAPPDEIRLVEVDDTRPEFSIKPFDNGPIGGEYDFHVVIVDLNGDQWDQIQRGELPLPEGWSLEGMQTWGRRS